MQSTVSLLDIVAELRVSYMAVWALVKAGKLPAQKVKGQWRVPMSSFLELKQRYLKWRRRRAALGPSPLSVEEEKTQPAA